MRLLALQRFRCASLEARSPGRGDAAVSSQSSTGESGIPPQRGQTLVSEESLKKMGKEIVRLCDGIERHGLVDYEYGVREELVIESMHFRWILSRET